MKVMIQQLKEFIAIPTIANDDQANENGIKFVSEILMDSGFQVSLAGESPTGQPVVVGRFSNPNSNKKVVLYGHYDVEKIRKEESWKTPPFQLTEVNGRYFCRGIADNKGILLSRLLAVKELYEQNQNLPNILWIIQGEEEVAGQTPFEVIPELFAEFQASLYVEETGVYKKGIPLIFHVSNKEEDPSFIQELNNDLYNGKARIENRHLNKFTTCPFVTNIPEHGHYLGFGPNDGACRIHRDNESLSVENLEHHTSVFKKFIDWVNKTEV